MSSFAQNEHNDKYNLSIEIIKKSNEFLEYCSDYNVNGKVKVDLRHNSLCEMLLPKEIDSYCILEQCKNELLTASISKNRELKKSSDKGRKKLIVRFSNVVCDSFIVLVEYRGNHRKFLRYAFKINENNVILINTSIFTIDF
ncbi:hypothetical protein [Flavobacterium sp.]|uniref:hypothetical protein n=1 Tax=Flavobacterium sp. TaxID=239 RepID=UPI002A7F5EB7|nr:hypothetical protein [Flavobacterium sp.]